MHSERTVKFGLIFGSSLQRVDAAKARIESLNPLVTVEALAHHEMMEKDSLEALVMTVDLVCVTDWDRAGLVGLTLPIFRSPTLIIFKFSRSASMTFVADTINHFMQAEAMVSLDIYFVIY